MKHYIEIEKADIEMSFEEFEKEHTRLIKVLKTGSKKELLKEAKLQEEEYIEYKEKQRKK